MYPTSGATIRADINIKVEEAAAADTFFIADKVLPTFSVDAKSGTYPKLSIAPAELLNANATERSEKGSYGEVSRAWGTDTYDCVDRGLEEAVDDAAQKDIARFFGLEASTARWVLRNMRLAAEVRAAAAVINAGTFGATNSAVAYTIANLATIDFAQDLLAAIERVNDNAQAADTVVMSSTVFNRIKLSTKLQAWVRGTIVGEKDSPITAKSLAAAFMEHGIKNVYIGRARQNVAKKGQSKSIANVWPNTHVWVGSVNPNASSLQDGGAGFTLCWSAEGGLYTTETYRNENRRSNMVRVRQNCAEKIVDATAGTLITTQFA